jgi:hypothetical protein
MAAAAGSSCTVSPGGSPRVVAGAWPSFCWTAGAWAVGAFVRACTRATAANPSSGKMVDAPSASNDRRVRRVRCPVVRSTLCPHALNPRCQRATTSRWPSGSVFDRFTRHTIAGLPCMCCNSASCHRHVCLRCVTRTVRAGRRADDPRCAVSASGHAHEAGLGSLTGGRSPGAQPRCPGTHSCALPLRARTRRRAGSHRPRRRDLGQHPCPQDADHRGTRGPHLSVERGDSPRDAVGIDAPTTESVCSGSTPASGHGPSARPCPALQRQIGPGAARTPCR